MASDDKPTQPRLDMKTGIQSSTKRKQENKPVIFHVITGLGVGGAERSIYNILKHGLNEVFDNHVISLTGAGHYSSKIQEIGVALHCFELKKSPTRTLLNIRKLVQENSPDVIQGWMYHGNLIAYLAKKTTGSNASLVWNIRNALDDINKIKPTTRQIIKAGKFLSNVPKSIIYNSDNSKAQHSKYGYNPDHSRVIPNGFDINEWRPAKEGDIDIRQAFSIPKAATVIGYIGRNHPQKNLSSLLHAFALAQSSHLDLYFILIGRGINDDPKLTQIIKSIPPSRIRILGEIEDIPQFVRAMNYLCLPSYYEGFPNVVGEAMASGVICLATDVGDNKKIIGDSGWIIESPSTDDILTTLSRAINAPPNENQKKRQLAREKIKNFYSIESTVRSYRNLYEELSET